MKDQLDITASVFQLEIMGKVAGKLAEVINDEDDTKSRSGFLLYVIGHEHILPFYGYGKGKRDFIRGLTEKDWVRVSFKLQSTRLDHTLATLKIKDITILT